MQFLVWIYVPPFAPNVAMETKQLIDLIFTFFASTSMFYIRILKAMCLGPLHKVID